MFSVWTDNCVSQRAVWRVLGTLSDWLTERGREREKERERKRENRKERERMRKKERKREREG